MNYTNREKIKKSIMIIHSTKSSALATRMPSALSWFLQSISTLISSRSLPSTIQHHAARGQRKYQSKNMPRCQLQLCLGQESSTVPCYGGLDERLRSELRPRHGQSYRRSAVRNPRYCASNGELRLLPSSSLGADGHLGIGEGDLAGWAAIGGRMQRECRYTIDSARPRPLDLILAHSTSASICSRCIPRLPLCRPNL